jgi:hypothetical protein
MIFLDGTSTKHQLPILLAFGIGIVSLSWFCFFCETRKKIDEAKQHRRTPEKRQALVLNPGDIESKPGETTGREKRIDYREKGTEGKDEGEDEDNGEEITRSTPQDRVAKREWEQLLSSIGPEPDTRVEERLNSQGLPRCCRRRYWLQWSGAAELRRSTPSGFYAAISSGTAEAGEYPIPTRKTLGQIEKDLSRTCGEHPYFRSSSSPEAPGISSLRRVLTGCARFHDHIGYTQGMNFLAATLLQECVSAATSTEETTEECTASGGGGTPGDCEEPMGVGADMREEEDCFWILVAMIAHFNSFYRDGMPGLFFDIAVLARLVGSYFPRLHQLLHQVRTFTTAALVHIYLGTTCSYLPLPRLSYLFHFPATALLS